MATVVAMAAGMAWLNQAGTKLVLPDRVMLCGLKLGSFFMRLSSFSWAQTRISSMLMAPEPSMSRASRNMQSRMNSVASPPLSSSSKLISLSRAAEMWMMSCGRAPLSVDSTTRLRLLMLTGRPHSSEMLANLGRKAPSSLRLIRPRVRTVEATFTNPPE